MSPAAISILGFGIYLAMGGLLLFLVPQELCQFLHLRPPGDSMWVRLGGLFFLAFMKNPYQFISLQQKLGSQDALNEYIQHTGSALFACPPGLSPGDHLGDDLLA